MINHTTKRHFGIECRITGDADKVTLIHLEKGIFASKTKVLIIPQRIWLKADQPSIYQILNPIASFNFS